VRNVKRNVAKVFCELACRLERISGYKWEFRNGEIYVTIESGAKCVSRLNAHGIVLNYGPSVKLSKVYMALEETQAIKAVDRLLSLVCV